MSRCRTALSLAVLLLFAGIAPLELVGQDASKPLYRLPFAPGTRVLVLQGNNGPYGHTNALAYAYDFKVPIGTDVYAARSGVVLKTEARYVDGNRKPGEENYIFVDNGDGTFSRYYHLTKDGVFVQPGKKIVAGERIGKSGDTGASAGPHLHFDVTERCPEFGCQTIFFRFEDVGENPLQAGKQYEVVARNPH
jgi:murein DD-endopeptidase MepM/ murein hydrolase activator NlpD